MEASHISAYPLTCKMGCNRFSLSMWEYFWLFCCCWFWFLSNHLRFPVPPHLHREPQSPSLQCRKNTDFNSESSQSLSSDKVAAVGSGPHKDSSYSASHISQYLSWDAHGVQPGKEPLQISLYDTFKISIFLQTPIQGICCSTRRQLQRY